MSFLNVAWTCKCFLNIILFYSDYYTLFYTTNCIYFETICYKMHSLIHKKNNHSFFSLATGFGYLPNKTLLGSYIISSRDLQYYINIRNMEKSVYYKLILSWKSIKSNNYLITSLYWMNQSNIRAILLIVLIHKIKTCTSRDLLLV